MSLAPQRNPHRDLDAPASDGTQPAADRTHPLGFDFTSHVRRLCEDMVARVDLLQHIDVGRVAVSFAQTRKATRHGMYASLTPMRFAGGRMHTIRRGKQWGVQRLYGPDGREMLYILDFYLPRFLERPLREKLSTTMHELWHIGPKFDGDVRRFDGRCFAHGSSSTQYEAQVEQLVDRWLAAQPPEPIYAFLRQSFHDLTARHGRVYGRKIPTPKLIRLD